ncbi:MAG: hypothetical protein IT305_30160 [Chloroflexi bacterium]|nr:hypothetical protein [Chloroflexota bacterium]
MRTCLSPRGLRRPHLAVALLLTLAVVAAGTLQSGDALAQAGTAWSDSFDGRPASPTPFRPTGWDVTVHSRDRETWKSLEPMLAHHGSDCAPYPASHPVTRYDDAAFICNDHLMTAINASGYGSIELTPNRLVDLSGGEAVVRFDMTTLRSSGRDWIDIWLSPVEDHLQLPLHRWLPDLTGEPRHGVQVEMSQFNAQTIFRSSIVRDFRVTDLDIASFDGYETVLTPSAVRRDTFELRISRTTLKFGLPQYGLWWIDTQFADLGWDRAVLQLGHHSYTPTKECVGPSCGPNTWHWDNVSISRSIPFTLLRGDVPWIDAGSRRWVAFSQPTPVGGSLRFAAIGTDIEISFDGGGSWQPARARQTVKAPAEAFMSYWTPIPAGITRIDVRGQDWWGGGWMARDFSVWSSVQRPGACSPRPPLRVRTAPGSPGVLNVTVDVETSPSAPDNSLRFVRLGPARNARVEIFGVSVPSSGAWLTAPAGQSSVSFNVVRTGAGATLVPLTLEDACGPWPSFVGGGPSAF